MTVMDCIKVSFKNVISRRLRSVLTVMGMLIGISSVIIIYAIGSGGRLTILSEFDKLGLNGINISVLPGEYTSGEQLTIQDLTDIKSNVSGTDKISPVINGYGYAGYKNKSRESYIYGVNKDFEKILEMKLLSGRFITENDCQKANQIAVIDSVCAKKLFNTIDAVGKKFKLSTKKGSVELKVSGILDSENELISDMIGQVYSVIYMPYTTLQNLYQIKYIDQITITAAEKTSLDETGNRAVSLLNKKHKVENMYVAQNMVAQRNRLNNILNLITLILAAIGSVAVIVGSIGIMNTMLVSVSERVVDIGICKALGASKNNILAQFLTEGTIISIIGGALGIICGLTVSYIICGLLEVPVSWSWGYIGIIFAGTSLLGILAGLYPANAAAVLNPIDALREQ